ncbi:MAG: rRNA pseudouridine synthase [Cyclobacteriaceae bacterium]|nr:rRNA pseudouridine synthase [Cyclobacteriaceae bacterium]
MARPRKTTPGKTSFGKRSDAEKSFFHKKKERPEKRFDTERPRSAGKKFNSSEEPRFTRKPKFEKGTGEAGARPRFSKPFDKGEGTERPFRKSGGFGSRPEGPSRFSKKPFSKEGKDGDRPFRKSGSFGKAEGGSGFSKKPFQKRDAGDEKSFRRNDTRGDSEGRGFDRKSFQKRDFDKGGDKPFKKREPRSFDEKAGPKKPFEKRGEEKPFRKSSNYGLPYKRKSFDKVRDIKSTKRTRDEAKPKTDSDLIRLNKFIANSGVGSRREADELIKMGLVTVNGETITEMGHKVKITDEVRYEGKRLKAEKPVYILLNKPKGFITTTDDPQERNTVMNLVASAGKERIYPVGRLDRNTTGLLLLTNDGDLADKLTHPSYNVKKIYRVELDKPLTKNDFTKIKEGVRLEEGKAMIDDLAIVGDNNQTIGIELHIGWNRIVRRIFESLGYEVLKLDRVAYAGLDKKDLNRGQWRFLKPEEVVTLKHFK